MTGPRCRRAILLSLTAVTMTSSRTAYSGRTRKIVLAFDVGTTFSGISYRYGSFLCRQRSLTVFEKVFLILDRALGSRQ